MTLDIKELRKLVGVSQQKLADETGISRDNIAKWETTSNNPKVEDYTRLVNFFTTKGVLAAPADTGDLTISAIFNLTQAQNALARAQEDLARAQLETVALLKASMAESGSAFGSEFETGKDNLPQSEHPPLLSGKRAVPGGSRNQDKQKGKTLHKDI